MTVLDNNQYEAIFDLFKSTKKSSSFSSKTNKRVDDISSNIISSHSKFSNSKNNKYKNNFVSPYYNFLKNYL